MSITGFYTEPNIRLFLSSQIHCLTNIFDGQDVPNVESQHLISFAVRLFR